MEVHNLGTANLNLCLYKEATSAYTKATKLDPTNIRYFDRLIKVYLTSNSYQDFIETLTAATNLDPTNSIYFNCLGEAYLKLSSYKKAVNAYFKSVSCDNNLICIGYIKNLINSPRPDSEKQKMIIDLIIPLNKELIKNNIEVETAKMNIANALVQYTKLTKVGAKKLINKAKELYPEVSADKAQNKSDLLTEKENASMEINSRILDAYIQAEIASTELNEVKEAQEHHVKASSFFESTSEELKGATPDSLSKITDLTNIIEAYLFAPCGTEMTGAETILDMIGDIE